MGIFLITYQIYGSDCSNFTFIVTTVFSNDIDHVFSSTRGNLKISDQIYTNYSYCMCLLGLGIGRLCLLHVKLIILGKVYINGHDGDLNPQVIHSRRL
jgi:hypothetical protein